MSHLLYGVATKPESGRLASENEASRPEFRENPVFQATL